MTGKTRNCVEKQIISLWL